MTDTSATDVTAMSGVNEERKETSAGDVTAVSDVGDVAEKTGAQCKQASVRWGWGQVPVT